MPREDPVNVLVLVIVSAEFGNSREVVEFALLFRWVVEFPGVIEREDPVNVLVLVLASVEFGSI